MRTHRILLAALALGAIAPLAANAQEPARVYTSTFNFFGRGMLGLRTVSVATGDGAARQRVVVEVVEDSPAQKAGVMRGDTVLSINGLAASQQVMNLPFEPGDTVVLRVRRDGRERDITVVATEREATFAYHSVLPDSIMARTAILMDRMRADIDTIHLPRFEFRLSTGDSTSFVIVDGDTIRRYARSLFGNFHPDSVRSVYGRIPRILGDSSGFRIFSSIHGDSTHFRFRADTMHFAAPFEVMSLSATLGMRAVAGAELAELNPGLAQYFGATDGVLVLNAREGTPAARAGLLAGDVVVQADGTAVTSIAQLRRTIERARDRDVTLRVLRQGRNVDVTLSRN